MGKKHDNHASITLSSARMRPHHLLAAALFAAPLTSSAKPMEPATDIANFVAAGEAAAERAPLIADPQERALERYRGYQSWMDAYDVDGDQSRLCAARLLLLGIVDDDELSAPVRSDAAQRLADLEAELVTPRCDSVARVPLLDEATDSPKPQDEAVRPSPESAAAPALTPAASVDSPPLAGRGLLIAGGVTLGVGASLLGAMTYGLVEDFRAAAELRDFAQQKEAGTLTTAEWAQSQTVIDRGRAGAQLATLAGISGGLSVVTGAVLLVVGRGRGRRRSQNKPLAVTPSAGAGQAHIMLRGRF